MKIVHLFIFFVLLVDQPIITACEMYTKFSESAKGQVSGGEWVKVK